MSKYYRIVLVILVCSISVAPVMAAEIARVDIADGALRPLSGSAPLDCCGTSVYENLNGLYAMAATPRWNLMDDGAFVPGTAPVDVYCVRIAFHQTVSERLVMLVQFWDTVAPDGPVCNLTYIGGMGLDFGTVGVGTWWYEHVLTTPLTFPDDDWCVTIGCYQSYDPWVPSTDASPVFASGPPTVGSGDANVFYYDADGSGTFECPDEAASFGVGDDYLYLRLGADIQPSGTEPSNWGAIKALFR